MSFFFPVSTSDIAFWRAWITPCTFLICFWIRWASASERTDASGRRIALCTWCRKLTMLLISAHSMSRFYQDRDGNTGSGTRWL
jgi:hypothetical protein